MNRLEETIHAYVLSTEEHKGGLLLTARTPKGNLPLKVWKPDEQRPPRAGDYLILRARDLQAAEDELSRWKSISLDSKWNKPPNYNHQTVREDEVPKDVRNLINRDRTPQILLAKRFLEDPSPWRNREIHPLLMEFAEENKKRLFNAPAATGKHHAWRGGLLVHTAEVASNCLSILESPLNEPYREGIDRDALLLAAWFHDTGKMETYRMDGENPAIDGDLEDRVGHITISNLKFTEFARKNGLEGDLPRLVSHCILSHHERREWGSPVEPQTIEAHILCRADYISSRMPN